VASIDMKWLNRQASGTGVKAAFARRVGRGETWLLRWDSPNHDETSRAALAEVTNAYLASKKPSSSRTGRSTTRAGRVSRAPIRGVVVSPRCRGCGRSAVESGRRTLRVRSGGSVSVYHAECLDRERAGDGAGAGRPASGMRTTAG
jgi:hypothetical protein